MDGGWINDPSLMVELPYMFQAPAPRQVTTLNHLEFKKRTGHWHDEGPQLIGDCVGWGFARMVDYAQVLEADPNYERTSTEVIYAGSRVHVGTFRGRYDDGSLGSWAAKWLQDFGFISRPHLDRIGIPGTYNPERAREWGARGLPQNVLHECLPHKCKVTKVTSALAAAYHLENGRTVAVCSSVGFENDRNWRDEVLTVRDQDGFALPRGTWNHCMLFVSVLWGRRPGLLCTNQWPKNTVSGPQGPHEIPIQSWYVDLEVADRMLAFGDSWTVDLHGDYDVKQLEWNV